MNCPDGTTSLFTMVYNINCMRLLTCIFGCLQPSQNLPPQFVAHRVRDVTGNSEVTQVCNILLHELNRCTTQNSCPKNALISHQHNGL